MAIHLTGDKGYVREGLKQLLLNHGPFFYKRGLQFIRGGTGLRDFRQFCPVLKKYF